MVAELGMRVFGIRPGTGLVSMMRTLVLLLWFAARGSALYFHIGETEKKCFIEEIPDETMVIGAGMRGRVWDETVVLGRGMWNVGSGEQGGAGLAVSCRPRTQCHLALF